MKITKAIFGVNDSFYLEYWPKQAEMCKKILGWDPILFIMGEEESDFYEDGNGTVKKIKQVDWVDSGLQSCLVRYWAPIFFPDEVCIFCDIDMFMLSREYFIDQIKFIPDDELLIFTSDAYDPSREECKDLFKNNNLPFDLPMMYSTCYSAAKGNIFKKIMNLEGSYEEFLIKIKQRYPENNLNWLIDEFFFSDCVQNNDHSVNINRLRRNMSTPFHVPKRIEKWGIPEINYHIDQLNRDRDRDGGYKEFLLREGYYIDFHAPRPYNLYKESIDYVCDITMKKNDTFETMKGYPHSTVGIELFDNDGVIVDVGCLSWDWSNIFLGNRRVIGVDPFGENSKGAEMFRGVLGPFDGKTNLINEGLTSSVFSGRGEEFPMISWKSFCKMFNIGKVSVLKINIEGGEYSLLNSMDSEDFANIDQIAVSFHDWTNPSWKELTESSKFLLEKNGFYVQKIDEKWGWYLARKKKIQPSRENLKKVALISTFCDTEEKINILEENIRKIKSFDIDVIAISPIEIPQKIVDLCDYFFYTKDNELLKWPVRMYTHWYEMPVSEGKITTLQRGLADYGWAGLHQVKKLSQIALSFDYEIFYHLIYDLEIDEVVENEFKSNNINIVHPRRDPHHPETLWETTLHFMVFDRDMMEKIEREITLDEYLRTGGMAEGEVLKWKNKFNIPTSDHPVKDKIFYWGDYDFFDYSPFPEFKLFLSKNEIMTVHTGKPSVYEEILPENLRAVFHGFSEMGEIEIKINGELKKYNPNPWEIIEFDTSSQDVREIIITYNNKSVNFTDRYRDIMLNQIYYKYRS